MSTLKIYWSKNSSGGATLKREIKVTPLKINGDISKVPVDKTYKNNYENNVYILLQLEEKGIINQRLHSLYNSSKNGYYSVICGKKCYFDEDITLL